MPQHHFEMMETKSSKMNPCHSIYVSPMHLHWGKAKQHIRVKASTMSSSCISGPGVKKFIKVLNYLKNWCSACVCLLKHFLDLHFFWQRLLGMEIPSKWLTHYSLFRDYDQSFHRRLWLWLWPWLWPWLWLLHLELFRDYDKSSHRRSSECMEGDHYLSVLMGNLKINIISDSDDGQFVNKHSLWQCSPISLGLLWFYVKDII